VLCDSSLGLGGSWSRDNVILFAPSSPATSTGIMRVSSDGGTPTVVTTVDRATVDRATGDTRHRWLHFLPDGRHFLYTEISGPGGPGSIPSLIRIGSLDAGAGDVTLLQAESSASYASGHVVFARDDTLMAQPFHLEARQLRGDAFPLAEGVTREASRYVGASVSENGTLVYGQAGLDPAPRLTWFDRTGHVLGTPGGAAPYASLAPSPDERRVAVALATKTQKTSTSG
jgi:eukaryotic-like serine/threonine-protein kinase